MKTFKKHLDRKLRSDSFRSLYEEERQLAELALKIHEAREELGLSRAAAKTGGNRADAGDAGRGSRIGATGPGITH